MNEAHALDNAHSDLRNVTYLAPEPEYHEYFGMSKPSDPVDEPEKPGDLPADDDEGRNRVMRDWPIWPFLVIGGTLVLGIMIVFVWWHREQRSFGHVRNKHSRRLLSLTPSSDDSELSSRSSGNGDQFTFVSSAWQKSILSPIDAVKKAKKPHVDEGSDGDGDAATTDRSTSSASNFLDEGKLGDSQEQSGSQARFVAFDETPNGKLVARLRRRVFWLGCRSILIQLFFLLSKCPAFRFAHDDLLGSVSDRGSFDASVFTSEHNSILEDSSGGSSSASDSSSAPPAVPRRLQRNVL